MTFRRLFLLFILGIVVAWIVSTFQDSPGYMDADYYYVTGLRVVQGFGFSEPFLWNYMDNPSGLPHPSHAYWMPLTSLLAALGMFVTGSYKFASAQIGFILLAGFLPPLTASLSFSLNRDKTWSTWAGLLAVFSGFYLAYLPVTDSFVIYMLLGTLFFLVLFNISDLRFRSALLGILAGLLHLARADGLLWLIIAIFIAVSGFRISIKKSILSGGFTMGGYVLVMLPWMLRNYFVFGVFLAPGGTRALWLTSYDDLYAFPNSLITISRWWATGLSEIIRSRLWALGQNLQTALGVQGEIFLSPLILLGVWHFRKNSGVRWGVFGWLITLGVMTVVFPFAGARGGFFHSGAAFQTLMWALVPEGLKAFLSWGQQVRGWQREQATPFFQIAIVGIAALLSFYVGYQRIVGPNILEPVWNQQNEKYKGLEDALQTLGATSDVVVMVNNPPGYFAGAARPSIAIPNGTAETSLKVAERYQAGYLLLEYDHPHGLDQLYQEPVDYLEFRYLWSEGDTHIFAINPSP